MSLFSRIRAAFTGKGVPMAEDSQPAGAALGEPPALSHTLTVDRLHGILRQAEAGETLELFSLYRDMLLGHAHFQNLYNQRKLNVLTKALTIVPEDAANPDDVNAARICAILPRTRGWLTEAMNHLLDGHLYPLAVLQQVYDPAPVGNPLGLLYQPRCWQKVPAHLLDFTEGPLKLWNADPRTGARGAGKSDLVENRHIVHRGHLLTGIPDAWGGPLRAALFWWLFANMDRDWWIRFLDRFGAPFMVARYDSADDKSKNTLVRAFNAATRLFGLVITKETDVQVHAVASNAHGEAFEKMQIFANGELSKLILGQTMTVTAQAGGLGGAQANVQENVQGSIEAWDLAALAETVNRDIIGTFLRLNGIRGRAVLQVATDTTAELKVRSAFLETAVKAGLEPTDEAIAILNKASGLPMRRAAKPAAPALPALPLTALAADPSAAPLRSLGQPTNADLDTLAAKAAPALAAAFRGRYAPARHLIASAASAEELEAGIAAFFSGHLPPGEVADLTQQVLIAASATAAATTPR